MLYPCCCYFFCYDIYSTRCIVCRRSATSSMTTSINNLLKTATLSHGRGQWNVYDQVFAKGGHLSTGDNNHQECSCKVWCLFYPGVWTLYTIVTKKMKKQRSRSNVWFLLLGCQKSKTCMSDILFLLFSIAAGGEVITAAAELHRHQNIIVTSCSTLAEWYLCLRVMFLAPT